MSKEPLIDVALELPLDRCFTYGVPTHIADDIMVGKRVLVPFGKRVVTAYTVGFRARPVPPALEIKDVVDLIDEEPLFDVHTLEFFKLVASYYLASLGEVLGLLCAGNAKIRSMRYLHITDTGREEVERGGKDTEILLAVAKRISLGGLLKMFKNKPVYSKVNGLVKKGLISEKLCLTDPAGRRVEKIAAPCDNASHIGLRGPLQARVLSFLLERGETSVAALRKELGNVDQPLKRLEEKSLITITERTCGRDPFDAIRARDIVHEPNEAQKAALKEIISGMKTSGFRPYLLYGITGSGKTLVYMKAIEEAVSMGKRVIFLVPEISLASWPAGYLSRIYPGRVAIIHSGLSEGERLDQWHKIRNGKMDVVVGARSALFAPVRNLGLIVVDEEHDASYKQEEGVRYNARDVALMMGKFFGLTVILGSATPSVEAFYNAGIGRLDLINLAERVKSRPLPDIEIVDIRKRSGREGLISDPLENAIRETISNGNQAMLFLNRRGFSNFLICKECGMVFKCPNCSVSLTVHKGKKSLLCHYCDFSVEIPDCCPGCNGYDLSDPGIGTERIEEEVRKLFPGARVARMDRDSTRRKGSHSKIIDAMEKGSIDVLIGTQMIAKGHHFPNVTLVGIISGDTAVNIPDFRGSERAFQIITQAGGRAGRGEERGRVIIQTYNPEDGCFRWVQKHDYVDFFREEIAVREEVVYPPFCRLALVRVESNKEERAIRAVTEMRTAADRIVRDENLKDITILGPAPAFMRRLRGRYRWQMLVKGRRVGVLNGLMSRQKTFFESRRYPGVKLVIDVDPLSTL